jgi:hypothetical protein
MARYYAATRATKADGTENVEIDGAHPFPTYTAANEHNARWLARQFIPRVEYAVLLDVQSVEAFGDDLRLLLLHDPLLAAVFNLGRQVGQDTTGGPIGCWPPVGDTTGGDE